VPPRPTLRSGTKPRHPLAAARAIATEIVDRIGPGCTRIEIAGSVRREKPDVGDIEIVFASRDGTAERQIDALVAEGVLVIRGGYGPKNKFLRHVPSGIAVDLFATTEACWHNYMVCRTGPAASNMAIASAAIARGWRWHVYGSGFSRGAEIFTPDSEAAVFEFVGLAARAPRDR
jgi:DNA polymerase/3'-5' exonuclease PolX